ncbi:MAG: hypothetical protein QOJ70_3840 [Acidobacteriota bacterium]|jgi:hypothetical protein|nr:hypothetical protein [Acidobacteriota bacterium]MDT7810027.1 hypothetical protein [Acidobacteriota bacterium]
MRNRHTPTTLKGLLAATLVAAAAVAAPAQTASTTYRGAQHDPFAKFKPALKRKVEKKVPTPIAPPPIQARIDSYKAQKLAAMNLQQAAPKPTTALTLSEVQVIGITRTPRGYAAMVEATPIKLSYVVYPGEQFYDGMLVAIEETRLVFRKQTRWTDGHTDLAVETKALRVANAVTDSLTAQRNEPPSASAAPAASGDEKKSELSVLVEALKAIAASGSQQQAQPQQGGHEAQSAAAQGRP